VATGRGDDGTTGLFFGGDRVPKDDPRTEACGTIDETVAALGIARAEVEFARRQGVLPRALGEIGELVLRIQRELFVVGAELAANPAARVNLRDGETRVSATMVEGIDEILAGYEARTALPAEFVVPGETRASAALELARTVLRRAERRAVTLARAGLVSGERLLPYLNRLGDLLWVLARAAEQAEARPATPSRPTGRQRGERSRGGAGERGRAGPPFGQAAPIDQARHTQTGGGPGPSATTETRAK
jgi:cob(I)alamin adenosyltransferase